MRGPLTIKPIIFFIFKKSNFIIIRLWYFNTITIHIPLRAKGSNCQILPCSFKFTDTTSNQSLIIHLMYKLMRLCFIFTCYIMRH